MTPHRPFLLISDQRPTDGKSDEINRMTYPTDVGQSRCELLLTLTCFLSCVQSRRDANFNPDRMPCKRIPSLKTAMPTWLMPLDNLVRSLVLGTMTPGLRTIRVPSISVLRQWKSIIRTSSNHRNRRLQPQQRRYLLPQQGHLLVCFTQVGEQLQIVAIDRPAMHEPRPHTE